MRKEINEQRIETVAELSNILEIFANERKERDSLVNAQLINLHELITSNITSTFTNITSTKPSLERRSANLERPDLSNELLDTYKQKKSGVFDYDHNDGSLSLLFIHVMVSLLFIHVMVLVSILFVSTFFVQLTTLKLSSNNLIDQLYQ